MIIVADTSPLNYLLLIGASDLLPRLYQQVFVPPQVLLELQDAGAPELVRNWAAAVPPTWLAVRAPTCVRGDLLLDAGETHAISLALEIGADRLLIDERRGRDAARQCGLVVVGTLGVLDAAAEQGLVDLALALDRLRRTTFRADQRLIEYILRRNQAGRRD